METEICVPNQDKGVLIPRISLGKVYEFNYSLSCDA